MNRNRKYLAQGFFALLLFGIAPVAWLAQDLEGQGAGYQLLMALLLIAVVVVAFLLARRWFGPPGPPPASLVEAMERQHPQRKARIDELVRLGDCVALRAETEILGYEDMDADDVPEYLAHAWEEVGCEGLDYTVGDLVRLMTAYYPDRKAGIDDLADHGDRAALEADRQASYEAFEPQFIWEYITHRLEEVELELLLDGGLDEPERPREPETPQPNRLSILTGRDPGDDR